MEILRTEVIEDGAKRDRRGRPHLTLRRAPIEGRLGKRERRRKQRGDEQGAGTAGGIHGVGWLDQTQRLAEEMRQSAFVRT